MRNQGGGIQCGNCGANARVVRGQYKFIESGLGKVTLQGIETIHMIRKGRVRRLPKENVLGQADFIAGLFGLAA